MLTEKELMERDSKRNIGEELLIAVRQVKSGEVGRVYDVKTNYVVEARLKCGLSQSKFAEVLQISHRTLQQWEQGKRNPSGAADTLLKIVCANPEVLKYAF